MLLLRCGHEVRAYCTKVKLADEKAEAHGEQPIRL